MVLIDPALAREEITPRKLYEPLKSFDSVPQPQSIIKKSTGNRMDYPMDLSYDSALSKATASKLVKNFKEYIDGRTSTATKDKTTSTLDTSTKSVSFSAGFADQKTPQVKVAKKK